jgi:hypothetical protein
MEEPERPGGHLGDQVAEMALPAFIKKTWDILETPRYHHLISWGARGDTIVVHQVSALVVE